jgi:hypothetical protein
VSLYLVAGRLAYRGHEHGVVFEATLDPSAESRAIGRGAIRVIERSTPSIKPGSYRLPAGWSTTQQREG